MPPARPLADLIARMESMLAPLEAAGDSRAYFLATYTRVTKAVEAAEDRELRGVEPPGDRTLLDRLLVHFNRWASLRFVTEARVKVWANAVLLNRARRDGTIAAGSANWRN